MGAVRAGDRGHRVDSGSAEVKDQDGFEWGDGAGFDDEGYGVWGGEDDQLFESGHDVAAGGSDLDGDVSFCGLFSCSLF